MTLCKTTIAAVLSTALLAGTAQAVPTLTLTSSAGTVMVGQTFTVTLQGSDFDDTAAGAAIDTVSGGQNLQLSFGAGVLELLDVTIAPAWNFAAANKPGTIDNVAGTLSGLGFGAFPALTADSFDVASFEFRALAAGSANLVLAGGQVVGRVANVAGSTIAVAMPAALVAVSPVPEPAPWLLLAGTLAAAGLRRLALRPKSVE